MGQFVTIVGEKAIRYHDMEIPLMGGGTAAIRIPIGISEESFALFMHTLEMMKIAVVDEGCRDEPSAAQNQEKLDNEALTARVAELEQRIADMQDDVNNPPKLRTTCTKERDE